MTVMKRLNGLNRDPWADLGRVRQKLPTLEALRRRA
jgi:hypothetical protein